MPITSPQSSRTRLDRAESASSPSNHHAVGLLQLVQQMMLAADAGAAARIVTSYVPAPLNHCHMAVGVAGRDGTCRLLAVTGREQLDHRSDRVRAIETALDETMFADRPEGYSRQQRDELPAKTHQQLAQLTGSHWVKSHPLHDSGGVVVGAWLVWGDGDDAKTAAATWLQQVEQPIGSTLKIVAQAHQGPVARLAEKLRKKFRPAGRRRRWTMAAVATVALLAVPIPYRIHCQCVLEPVTRRYVAAPFDATLARTLVEPGDVVRAGQPLLELDQREIEWELASLGAAYEKAQKGRDAAMADRQAAATQLARLEMEQIEHQLALLGHRQANLKINSPFDGVVISGDLQRAEGAPVTVGQTLLEVAPLDKVIVEVEVPERSVAHLRDAASTTVRLDAFPGQSWSGNITTIHPRAEIRDDQQAFVAELELENGKGDLRPGMRGRAKVSGGWAPTGWILFHRPYHALLQWLGW
ncbi:MAG: efflux RND transporter periplasmic adaptor subunit [Aeoliella sp.]